MESINFNNKIYLIKKNHNENKSAFNQRMWYIVNQNKLKENNTKSLQDIINMSNIYINEIINGCKY
mgnify:CR=1 FL=1|jgi:hypothetical protein